MHSFGPLSVPLVSKYLLKFNYSTVYVAVIQGKNNMLAVSLIIIILAGARRTTYIDVIGCSSLFVNKLHRHSTTVFVRTNSICFDKHCSVRLSGDVKQLVTMDDFFRKVN
jgi:hypothetical protein